MNKKDLITALKNQTNLKTKDIESLFEKFAQITQSSLQKGETVVLPYLGKFVVKTRKSRIQNNPRTNAKMTIPTKHLPNFRSSKDFKTCIY